MQLVQCSRCGKAHDLDAPVVFRHEDDTPMEPADRPQPWVLLTLQSVQPGYLLPDGSRWPAQERVLCDTCMVIVLGALSRDFESATNVTERLVPEPPLEAVLDAATKADVVVEPDPVVADELAADGK